MIDPLTLLAFLPAALALNMTPGADMMFCLGQGLRNGPRAAMAANAGIAVGGLVHVALAGAGLGAVMAAHPQAFAAIRWMGVGYLLWLAVMMLRAGNPVTQGHETPAAVPIRAFRAALLVNLSNPKVILFVLAFLPQFVDPARPVLPQFIMLGLVFSLGGFIVNGVVGVGAGRIARRLVGAPRLSRLLGWLAASIFAGLAVRLAFLERV